LALWRLRTGRLQPFRSELVALEAALLRRAGEIDHETNVLERLLAEAAPNPRHRKASVRVRSLILTALGDSTASRTTSRSRTAPDIASECGLHRVSVDRALEWMSKQPEPDVHVLHARYRIVEGRRLPRAWALTRLGEARVRLLAASAQVPSPSRVNPISNAQDAHRDRPKGARHLP
jgi:hypothetical protein